MLFQNVWLSGGFRIFLDGGRFFLLLDSRTDEGLLVQAKAVYYYANLVIEYEFVVDSGKSEVFAGKVQQGRSNRKGRKSRILEGNEITAIFVLTDIANWKPARYSHNARSRVLQSHNVRGFCSDNSAKGCYVLRIEGQISTFQKRLVAYRNIRFLLRQQGDSALGIYLTPAGQVYRRVGLERYYEVNVPKPNFLSTIVDIRLIRIYKVVSQQQIRYKIGHNPGQTSELYKRSLAVVGADQVNSKRSLLRKSHSLAVDTLYLAYAVFDLIFQGLQEYYVDDRLAYARVKTDFYIFYVGRSASCNAKVGKSRYCRVFRVLFMLRKARGYGLCGG